MERLPQDHASLRDREWVLTRNRHSIIPVIDRYKVLDVNP
jgi:hypothetical protein